ncbi:hypothetical protein ACHAWU_008957 [Discostella pseudostelligera]|uniref:Heme oxygenase n=1 Tax=Discostella pseudostelligera TaxID=259834 RepID=A0ABD3MH26_9STRA
MRFYIALIFASASATNAFVTSGGRHFAYRSRSTQPFDTAILMSTETTKSDITINESMPVAAFPPILDELRDVAMRLHTREQAPREGQAEAPAKPEVPYVPTQMDYLQFLVDSLAVYEVLENIVNNNEQLNMFRNSGIERTKELEKDIAWMCAKFNLERPAVGKAGKQYAEQLNGMIKRDDDIPEFICHYYNYYFAHLAGGRMIGKQMSKLLLDGETLEFYKWGEDVNELKAKVKAQIEELAKQWSREERDKCLNATAGAFRGGGAINGYLYGASPH